MCGPIDTIREYESQTTTRPTYRSDESLKNETVI
jgi:hypothetical protein